MERRVDLFFLFDTHFFRSTLVSSLDLDAHKLCPHVCIESLTSQISGHHRRKWKDQGNSRCSDRRRLEEEDSVNLKVVVIQGDREEGRYFLHFVAGRSQWVCTRSSLFPDSLVSVDASSIEGGDSPRFFVLSLARG